MSGQLLLPSIKGKHSKRIIFDRIQTYLDVFEILSESQFVSRTSLMTFSLL